MMDNEKIEDLINLNPTKLMTQNIKEVASAMESSAEANDQVQLRKLAQSGDKLLKAVIRLSEN